MAEKRIIDLPEEDDPVASEFVAIDAATTRKTTIERFVEIGRPTASQAEAEAGVNPVKAMTPLTASQHLAARIGVDIASAAQGAKADTSLQPTTGIYRIGQFVDAAAAYIPSTVDRVFLEDRRAYFTLASAEPAHPVKFQSGDRWFEPDVKTLQSPMCAGAIIDGVADDTQAYQDFFAYIKAKNVKRADLGSGVAKCSKVLYMPPIEYVGGPLTLDFSAVVSAVNFPENACVYTKGSDPIALPALAADAVKGNNQIVFSSAPGLVNGDLVCIFNPTAYSLNGFRAYYKAGEWARVLDVSGTTVTLTKPLTAGYSSGSVDLYKYGKDRISLKADLTVIGSQAVSSGVVFFRLQQSYFELTVYGAQNAQIRWYECVDCVVRNAETRMPRQDLVTAEYGGYVANCQGMDMEGRWHGARHGVTLGGTGATGFITPPCRDIQLRGEFSNMQNTGATWNSCQAHGNSLDYIMEGIFHNGVTIGGNNARIRGLVRTFAGTYHAPVSASELHGANIDVDVDIVTDSNPAINGRGVVDIGGQSIALSPNTVEGGVVKISGTIRAPNATRIFRMRNQGAVGKIVDLDLSGLRVHSIAAVGESTSVEALALSGDVINSVNLTGFKMPTGHGWSVYTVPKVYGWSQDVKTAYETLTTEATTYVDVNYRAPKIPCVSLTIGDASPGGKTGCQIAFNNNTITNNMLRAFLISPSGNFTVAETVPLHVRLTVEE